MNISKERRVARKKRQVRVRRKITGSVERPRLCVFRSAKHIYAQIIEDVSGKTLVAASTAPNLDGLVINVGSGNETSVRDLAQAAISEGHLAPWPHKGRKALADKPDWCAGN